MKKSDDVPLTVLCHPTQSLTMITDCGIFKAWYKVETVRWIREIQRIYCHAKIPRWSASGCISFSFAHNSLSAVCPSVTNIVCAKVVPRCSVWLLMNFLSTHIEHSKITPYKKPYATWFACTSRNKLEKNKNFLQNQLRCRNGIKSAETSGCYRVKH